jgi:uncharacterized protein YacL
MADSVLRRAGRIVLASGIGTAIAGEVAYILAVRSAADQSASLDVTAGGVVLVILGLTAWALATSRTVTAQDHVDARLHRAGFVLFLVGTLGLVAGVIGSALEQLAASPQIDSRVTAGSGFILAVVGAVIMALCDRGFAHRSQSQISEN